MFLIFKNDLPLGLENVVTSTDLYADDTTVIIFSLSCRR